MRKSYDATWQSGRAWGEWLKIQSCFEWCWSKSFDLGWEISFGEDNYDSEDVKFHLALFFVRLWLTLDSGYITETQQHKFDPDLPKPKSVRRWKWARKFLHPNAGRTYSIRLHWYGDENELVLRWIWGQPEDQHHSADPWYRRGSVYFKEWLQGPYTTEVTTIAGGALVLEMPEATYYGTYDVRKFRRVFKRWKNWHFFRTDIDIPQGVPEPGKGENGWDCGPSYTSSISFGGTTDVEDCVRMFRESVLDTRRRRGAPEDYNEREEQRSAADQESTSQEEAAGGLS